MIKEGHFNLSTMLNLKRPMDVPIEYTQTRAYIINKGGMDFERSSNIPMETDMSKGVGEHYLCISECIYRQHIWKKL